jgi:hypothetical protein
VRNLLEKLAFKWALIALASLYLYSFWERRDNGRYALTSIYPTVVMDTRTGSIFALGETILHSKPTLRDIRDKDYPPVH